MHHVVTTLLIKPLIILTNVSQNILKTCLLFLSLCVTGMLRNPPPYPCEKGLVASDVPKAGAAFDGFVAHALTRMPVQHTVSLDGVGNPERQQQHRVR
jgi:hypothetical protein